MKPSDLDISETSFNRGIERESLRVNGNGELALTPHPAALGAKLTHPCITTDFCESQLELITPVFQTVDEVLDDLERIHSFVHHSLSDELLWPASMPCRLPSENDIPLADYGRSNIALQKKTYRSGLGVRYGRSMQTISAVHYNFSPVDALFTQLATLAQVEDTAGFRNRRYFGMMRNFRELSWLPVYLFGASPAVASSFVKADAHPSLVRFDNQTLFCTHATSLRNGSLGYQSDTQNGLMDVCYNGIDSYISALVHGITTEHEPYARLNTDPAKIIQLNSSLIQSEAEFYTTIRAKCVPRTGENFLRALSRGVGYVEVRLLDLNPFAVLGIDADAVCFLDLLLLHCLLSESPDHPPERCRAVANNLQAVVWEGRKDPAGMHLLTPNGHTSLASWGIEVLAALEPWAEQLGDRYVTSLQRQREKLQQTALTPSAEMLTRMRDQRMSFLELGTELAQQQHLEIPRLDAVTMRDFEASAKQSLDALARRESTPEPPFREFLADLNNEYHKIRATLAEQALSPQ